MQLEGQGVGAGDRREGRAIVEAGAGRARRGDAVVGEHAAGLGGVVADVGVDEDLDVSIQPRTFTADPLSTLQKFNEGNYRRWFCKCAC